MKQDSYECKCKTYGRVNARSRLHYNMKQRKDNKTVTCLQLVIRKLHTRSGGERGRGARPSSPNLLLPG